MFLYSVSDLGLIFRNPLEEFSRSTLNSLNNVKLVINNGELETKLKYLYTNVDPGLGLVWGIVIVVVVILMVFGIIGKIIIHYQRKREFDTNEDEGDLMNESAVIRKQQDNAQKQFWAENMTLE